MKKVLLALLILVLFLVGCAKQHVMPEPEEVETPEEETEEPPESVPEPVSEEGKGILKILVSDQENVISDFDSLQVTFSSVKVYEPKSSTPVEGEMSVVADLTELQGANALKLLEVELDEGSYSKIKLYASSIKGILLGNEVEVVIPGNALLVEKNFGIKEGDEKSFVVDLTVVKTGKIITTTGLEQYEIKTIPLKSGMIPVDVTSVKEMTSAEMMSKINKKAGMKYDKHVFFTQDKGFAPSVITIEAGTKVIWENKDTRQLGIIMSTTIDRMIRAGGSYEYTFNRAGTYPYNMKYYVSNKGEIKVVLPEVKVEEEFKPSTPKTINIESTGFRPAEISITRGTKVSFVNKDTKYHHLAITGDPVVYNLAPGDVYSTTFNELGGFSFHDPYNVADYAGKLTITS